MCCNVEKKVYTNLLNSYFHLTNCSSTFVTLSEFCILACNRTTFSRFFITKRSCVGNLKHLNCTLLLLCTRPGVSDSFAKFFRRVVIRLPICPIPIWCCQPNKIYLVMYLRDSPNAWVHEYNNANREKKLERK